MTEGNPALDFLIEANLKSKAGIEEVPADFLDRHLKKIKELNEIYRPLAPGDIVSFTEKVYTKTGRMIKVDIGDRGFIRGIVGEDKAWIVLSFRKTAIKVPISILKRWRNGKA